MKMTTNYSTHTTFCYPAGAPLLSPGGLETWNTPFYSLSRSSSPTPTTHFSDTPSRVDPKPAKVQDVFIGQVPAPTYTHLGEAMPGRLLRDNYNLLHRKQAQSQR